MKVLVVTGVLAVAVVLGTIAGISALHSKSRSQIASLISEIRPGMPFSSVASRLGRESQTFTNAAEVETWGTTKEQRIVTNSTLHLFVHGTVPMRWICIYTDRDSQTVLYASWRDM